MDLRPGVVLGSRWELVAPLARGGMSDLFRARDQRRPDSDEVAVKVLRAGHSRGHERFASEIATLQQLTHPNIVELIDADDRGETPYLVMELLPGRTLAEELERGPITPERAKQIAIPLARALAFAHDRGVINRDVKPSNVLFAADGTVKLTDFGVALLADSSRLTTTGTAVGTASFIAPEQLTDGRNVGPRADVYSLGLVLLEGLTGERSFDGLATEAALARLHRDPRIPRSLPTEWRRLLTAMTARDPGSRPTASEVADLLEDGLPLDRTATLLLATVVSEQRDSQEDAVTTVMGSAGYEPELPGDDGPPTEPFSVASGEPAERDAGTATLTSSSAGADAAGADAAGADAAGATTATRRRPDDRTTPQRQGRARWVVPVIVLVVALVLAGAIALIGPFGTDPVEEAPPSDLPAELDDAFRELERTVRP
jgi:eukaryotic-like serine/threonine-protein kinase